jgi:endonuclease/exonuclease/phosphatase family metal-dependent hydrolase
MSSNSENLNAAGSERRRLKVLGYNICEGGDGRLDQLATVIRSERPDAAALLEANDREAVAALARALGMRSVFGEANCAAHVAWLTHLPIRRTCNHRLPGLAKTLLQIDLADAPVTLFATHFGSRHDARQPIDEVPIVLGILQAAAARRHLLVGDFNSLAPDDPVGDPPAGVQPRGDAERCATRLALQPLFHASYTDCFRHANPTIPGYTYPATAPWLRLDYVFASPEMAHQQAGVVTDDPAPHASDHLPVWALFE